MRNKRLLFSAAFSMLFHIINMIVGLIVPRLMISAYGSEVNGLIASIAQFLSYITLMEAGIGAISRALLYKPLSERDMQVTSGILKSTGGLYRRLAVYYIVYSLGLSIMYPLAINRTVDLLFTGSLIIIISVSSIVQYYFGISYNVLLMADQHRYITDIIQIILIVVNCVLTVLLIRLGASVHMVKLASSLIFFLRPFMLKRYVECKYKLEKEVPPVHLPRDQKNAGILHNVAWYVRSNTDIAILTFFGSLSSVSVYSVYRLVALSISNVISGLFSGSEAMFGNVLVTENPKNTHYYFNNMLFIINTLSVILYTSAMVLIIPFIRLYTVSITDTNYILPILGYFLLLSELINSLRKPYMDVITASGHFRQTRFSAFIETALNVGLSLLLVGRYGAAGITFATIIALLYRTIYILIYCSNNLIHFSVAASLKRLLISLAQVAVILLLSNVLFQMSVDSYIVWIWMGLLSIVIASTATIIINALFYWNETKQFYMRVRSKILKCAKHSYHYNAQV